MTTAADWAATSLTLDELCEETGVTVRTVRYYIAEGLLPPPIGHGTSARYTGEHLDRLIVIAALKDRFLPLREIRRTLSGMEPDAIAAMARESRSHGGDRERADAVSKRAMAAPAPAASPARSGALRSMMLSADDVEAFSPIAEASLSLPVAAPLRAGAVSEPGQATAWMRVRISEDAELLIDAERYHRHEEQIAALVAWAQRILK